MEKLPEKILREQLELLAERSKNALAEELPGLSQSMVEIYKLLNKEGPPAKVVQSDSVLTKEQLKAYFDDGAAMIKDFINRSFLDELISSKGRKRTIKTETYEMGEVDTCSIDLQDNGCNIKGPAVIVVIKEEADAANAATSNEWNQETLKHQQYITEH